MREPSRPYNYRYKVAGHPGVLERRSTGWSQDGVVGQAGQDGVERGAENAVWPGTDCLSVIAVGNQELELEQELETKMYGFVMK